MYLIKGQSFREVSGFGPHPGNNAGPNQDTKDSKRGPGKISEGTVRKLPESYSNLFTKASFLGFVYIAPDLTLENLGRIAEAGRSQKLRENIQKASSCDAKGYCLISFILSWSQW